MHGKLCQGPACQTNISIAGDLDIDGFSVINDGIYSYIFFINANFTGTLCNYMILILQEILKPKMCQYSIFHLYDFIQFILFQI